MEARARSGDGFGSFVCGIGEAEEGGGQVTKDDGHERLSGAGCAGGDETDQVEEEFPAGGETEEFLEPSLAHRRWRSLIGCDGRVLDGKGYAIVVALCALFVHAARARTGAGCGGR